MSLSSTVFLLNLIGVLLFQGLPTKGGVMLSPSTVSACPEGLITLRCMLSTGSVATWTISVPNNTIRTVLILQSEQASTVQELTVGSNMISVERTSSDPFEVRLSANVSSSFNGSLISCSDGINTETATISITGRPIPLQGLTQSEQFSDGNVTVVFQWSASVSTTYSVKVEPSVLSVVMTGNTSVELTVPYNSPHSVTIVALNCAGYTNTTIEILYVNCGYPAVGENVVVGGYSFPAQNGSVVSFNCDDHSMLAEQVLFTTSRCDNNGKWSPEPAGFRCIVDCGAPIAASMVIIEPYVNTTRGSVITYHCDDGLIPNNTITMTCESDGQWSRDPSRHVCRLPTAAVCGDPAPPTHGSIAEYTSTVEGTTLTFQCDEGYSQPGEMTTTCTANGQWEPNPEDTECMMMDGKASAPSPAVPVAIAVVLIILLVITITSVTIIVVIKVRKRGKDAENSQFGLELQDTNETPTEYCTTKHPGPRGNQSVTVNTNTLVYAGLDLPSEKKFLTSHVDHADNPTSYADINFTATNNVTEVPCGESADDLLNLDSLLIQLKPEVTSKWELFARVVGLSQEVIKDLSNCGPDERMVEMLDYWLRHHPSKPTWREVAQILEELHLYQLADDLLKVYETGELPVPFDMNEVPEGTLPRNEPPPPLPPKLPDLDDGPASPPLVCDLPPKPPPHGGLPVHAPPPLPPPYHENGGSILPPRRPPKSHSHGMPRRPPEAGTAVPALPPKPKT